jgi:hypothetical protein
VVRRAIRITQFYGLDFIRFPNFHFGSLVGVMDSELLRFDHEGHKFGPAYQLLQDQLATIRPGLVVLDTLPDFFGGNEIDRRQTSIFIRMLDRISMLHDCAIVCSAHPSMRGRSSGRFDSGNTGIEGKMRARLSLHDPGDGNEDDGESPEERAHRIALNPTEKRILTRQNSNYAKPGETIELTIKDGVFTPAALDVNAGPSRNLSIRAKFLECLRAIKQEGRTVHDVSNSPSRYAPKVFRAHPLNRPTRFSMRDFETAMNELIGSNPPRIKLGRDRRSPFLYEV